MDKEYADLHIHSCFSDSSFTPSEIVVSAKEKGFSVIAVTDHDTVQGVEETLSSAYQKNIKAIPACEISTIAGSREVHILGYHLDWQNNQLIKTLAMLRQQRVCRVREIIRKLALVGVVLHPDDVFAISGVGSPGRVHVALAIIQKGYEKSISDVFIKYLRSGSVGFVPKIGLSTEEAIDLILTAKGIPVLAHPSISNVDEFIPRWVKRGLQGLEVYHPSQGPEISRFYERLAQKHHLCTTGGSDCHGLLKETPLLGKIKVPYECCERLNQLKADRDSLP